MKTLPFLRFLLFFSVLLLSGQQNMLHAQGPKLSIQGILKKTSGDAVPDGSYSLTFKLYTVETGGTAVWTEMQSAVDVISGIYSTVLGNTTPLTISFNQVYYLGVTVGSTEMTPRIQLTSAPYALSLIGVNNQFPSSGQVIADSIDVNGNVLARSGAPGLNGINKNGYGFLGDKDSGMYSTSAGQVSLYVNKDEQVKVTPDSVRINGDISLQSGKTISYNGLDDWRLVETDYFLNAGDFEGWQAYNPLSGQGSGWNSPNAVNPTMAGANNVFIGKYIRGNAPNQVMKKSFNLSSVGNYNYIKVKFKYYFFDSWDGNDQKDMAFGAIAETNTGTGMRIGYLTPGLMSNYGPDFNGGFPAANQWAGHANYPEYTENGEMTFFKCSACNDVFWLMFGASVNEDNIANNWPTPEENYGIGMIEIWVK